jgi:hypothetical protein
MVHPSREFIFLWSPSVNLTSLSTKIQLQIIRTRNMNDGSTTGIFALVRLAADLGLSPDALKAALERAYDMMQQTGNAGLSLHMALARLGYQVDGQALYAALGAFRNRFGAAFENMQREVPQNRPVTR